MDDHIKTSALLVWTRVNQHSPWHHIGWMTYGQKKKNSFVSHPTWGQLTTHVNHGGYLCPNHPHASTYVEATKCLTYIHTYIHTWRRILYLSLKVYGVGIDSTRVQILWWTSSHERRRPHPSFGFIWSW